MPVSIVVADDSETFRTAVVDVLRVVSDLRVVAAVGDGKSALQAVVRHHPDVVIMDVDMPGGGAPLAAEIVRTRPQTRLLCLSGRDDAATVLHMIAAGVSGYVAKGGLDDDLATCVRRCAAGMFFVVAGCAPDVRRRVAAMIEQVDPGTDLLGPGQMH